MNIVIIWDLKIILIIKGIINKINIKVERKYFNLNLKLLYIYLINFTIFLFDWNKKVEWICKIESFFAIKYLDTGEVYAFSIGDLNFINPKIQIHFHQNFESWKFQRN